MYTWLVDLVRSRRRSQHRDREISLGSENFWLVNSIV